MKTTLDLQLIAKTGASIIISAKSKTTLDLQLIARSLVSGKLTIKDAGSKSTLDLQLIANTNPGNVIFDFTE